MANLGTAAAVVFGAFGMVMGLLARRDTKAAQRTKETIDANRQKLEGWSELVADLRVEGDRKDQIIDGQRRRIEWLTAALAEARAKNGEEPT